VATSTSEYCSREITLGRLQYWKTSREHYL